MSGNKCHVCQVEVDQVISWSNGASAQVLVCHTLALAERGPFPFPATASAGSSRGFSLLRGHLSRSVLEPGL